MSEALPYERKSLDIQPLSRERACAIGSETFKLCVMEGTREPELFNTVQGEGRYIGVPTAFMRLSECNLTCNFCDVASSWAFTERQAALHEDGIVYDRAVEQVELSVEEMAERAYEMNPDRLVVTGGEPLMQQARIIEFGKLIKEKNPDYWLELESNGTIPPKPELVELFSQFNISPKLTSSGNDTRKSLKQKSLEAWASVEQCDFKFVVTCEEDIDEILAIVESTDMPHNRVYLMPEGRTREELERHGSRVAELAMQHGFNLTERLHINLWGDKKNV